MKKYHKLWIVISLIIVFAAGLGSGILLEKQLRIKRYKKVERKRETVRFPTIETMAEQLSLTSEQQEQIRGFFRNNEEQFKSMQKKMRKDLSEMRIKLLEDIKSVLTEDQIFKFDEMIENYLSQKRKVKEKN